MLLGRPGGHTVPVDDFAKYEQALLRVIRDETQLVAPVITQMDFGHTDPMCVLPYGISATIDCDKQTLEIDDSAVV